MERSISSMALFVNGVELMSYVESERDRRHAADLVEIRNGGNSQ